MAKKKWQIVNGMINLNNVSTRYTHKNDRVELHGDKGVLACDLELKWTTNNEALAMFSPTLRADIYKVDDEADRKKGGNLLGVDVPLTVLKHPQVKTIKWDGNEIVGGMLSIHGVISGDDIEFDDVNISKWRIDPKDGGTVDIRFRAQVHPKKKQRQQLMDLLEVGEITVSVIPPEPGKEPAGTQQPIDGTGKETPDEAGKNVKQKTAQGMTIN